MGQMSFPGSDKASLAAPNHPQMRPRPAEVDKVRILVIDDHPMVRDGLAHLINTQDNLVCCAQAGSTAEALLALPAHKPKLVILDLWLRNADGLEFIKALIAQQPELKILILSEHGGAVYIERALRAGASGYVFKEQTANELLNAIRTVLAGEFYLPRGVAASLSADPATRRAGLSSGTSHLTDRELHVLHLLGSGLSTRQIADDLQLSLKTIETHRENLKRKLDLKSASQLIHFANQWTREHVAMPSEKLIA